MKNMLKNIGVIALGLALVAISVSPALVLADGQPVASITAPADGATFQVGQSITFRGQATGGTAPYTYAWNFGDGNTGAGQEFTREHGYAIGAVGPRTVRLLVTDFAGRVDTAEITLNIVAVPTHSNLDAQIVVPADGATFQVGQSITFRGQATGGTAPYTYAWNFGDGNTGAGQEFTREHGYAIGAVGPRTVRLLVTDFAGDVDTDEITLQINQAPTPTPTVDLKVNNGDGPITLNAGTSANLTWSSTNAAACTATGAWTGARPVTGAQSTGSLTVGAHTYTLTCTGAGGLATDAVTINVIANPTPTPSIDLKVNGSNGPVALNQGASATLSWIGTNVTACTATGAWAGIKPTTGSESTAALSTGNYTYNLSCTGAGRVVADSVTINVTDAPAPTPTVDLQASVNGRTVNLSWTSSNVNACTATGAWSGIKSTTGSETLNNVAVGTRTYNLSCTGAGRVVTDSATVTVTDGGPTTLVISNVRVTDITQTSAIVRWDTNLPANSRVIYDTVSHPDISGASEPNFGYAHSSATRDEDALVTEHAVQLTGLTANTQYFFRVLSR